MMVIIFFSTKVFSIKVCTFFIDIVLLHIYRIMWTQLLYALENQKNYLFHFIVMVTLLQWPGTEPEISLMYACIAHIMPSVTCTAWRWILQLSKGPETLELAPITWEMEPTEGEDPPP